jgi:hypothetical protein
MFIYIFPLALQPSAGYGLLVSHTRLRDQTQRRATVVRTPLGRVNKSSQKPPPDNTHKTDKHP